jgi:membrane-bound inhibitor of C-type lysozyme
MATNIKIIIGVVIGAVLGMGGYYVATHYSISSLKTDNTEKIATTTVETKATVTTSDTAKPVADVGYLCDAKKTIHAVYFKDKVIVELSDGRAMQLPQTISASGIRYANKDETYVFWSKGPTAYLEEMGKMTYEKCVELDTSSVEGM